MTLWNNISRNRKETVQDDKVFVLLCDALGDKVSFAVIKATIKEAKTATEISRENHLSLSSVYNKIKKLERLGIIQIQKIITDSESGKRVAYYTCKIKALEMSMNEKGATRIWLELEQFKN